MDINNKYLDWFKLGLIMYGFYFALYLLFGTKIISNMLASKAFGEVPLADKLSSILVSPWILGAIFIISGCLALVLSRWIAGKVKYGKDIFYKTFFVEKALISMIVLLLPLSFSLSTLIPALIILVIIALIAAILRKYLFQFIYQIMRWRLPQ